MLSDHHLVTAKLYFYGIKAQTTSKHNEADELEEIEVMKYNLVSLKEESIRIKQ